MNFKNKDEIVKGVNDITPVVQETLKLLERDPVYTDVVIERLSKGEIETRAFMAYFSKVLQPKNFLEVGVRRGWSTACVARHCRSVEIYAFDSWFNKNYAGAPNPGAKFVQDELKKINYTKPVNFIIGDSHLTLPKFFKENDIEIDLALIDGDHAPEGTKQDLDDVMPHMSVGGVLVFDDLTNFGDALHAVFKGLEKRYTNFEYFYYTDNKPGIGAARRIK